MSEELRTIVAAIVAIVLLALAVADAQNVNTKLVVETTTAATTTEVVTETTTTTTTTTTTSTTQATTQQPTTKAQTTTTTKKAVSTNSDDVDLLARLIYCEAGGCSYRNRQLVGSVVLNRMHSSSYPNTLSGVIYQKGQYSCTGKLYSVTPDSETRQIAADLLANGSICPSNVVYQSQYKQGSGVYEAIASPYGTTTYFCYA